MSARARSQVRAINAPVSDGSRGLPKTEVKTRVLRLLANAPQGQTKAELTLAVGETSKPTVQRCLSELKNDGVVEIDRSTHVWTLLDPDYRLSLDAPEADDLQAVLIAEALLGALMDDELRTRLRSLAERIDERMRLRNQTPPAALRTPIDVSFTSASRVRPLVLHGLLRAVRQRVVRICFTSPWSSEQRKLRLIEPWALRLHDSSWYVRAFDRQHGEPRTFRLAHIHRVSGSPDLGDPREPVPPADQIWDGGDPAFGIDDDRPATARVVLRNPVARWLSHVIWHPTQEDDWLDDQTLARTVPYASCREFARTLRAYADALISVDPPELRAEMLRPFSRVDLREIT